MDRRKIAVQKRQMWGELRQDFYKKACSEVTVKDLE